MTRTALAYVLALGFPPLLFGWTARLSTTYVRVEVGATRNVGVRAIPIGSPLSTFTPWVFVSTDPAIAHVDTTMSTPAPIDVPVTGVGPGTAGLYVQGKSPAFAFVNIEVVCRAEGPIENATPVVKIIAGKPVTLRVETPIAHRTAFTWYRGRNGDKSQPIGGAAGPELVLTPERGTEYVWVLATTPCSTSSAEFRIDVQPSKQRALRR